MVAFNAKRNVCQWWQCPGTRQPFGILVVFHIG